MYHTPRTATIAAETNCLVLELSRDEFTQVLMRHTDVQEGVRAIAKQRLRTFVLQDIVKKVPLFKDCKSEEFIQLVVGQLEPISVEVGDAVMVEGGLGDSMYFVSQGTLTVKAAGREVGTMRDGDFFGEIALVFDTPRTATVVAATRSQLFRLTKADFQNLSAAHGQESIAFKQVAKERFKKVLRVTSLFKGGKK